VSQGSRRGRKYKYGNSIGEICKIHL
jgi:hypothetical protein